MVRIRKKEVMVIGIWGMVRIRKKEVRVIGIWDMIRIKKNGVRVMWSMVRIRNEIRIRENWGWGIEKLGWEVEVKIIICFVFL